MSRPKGPPCSVDGCERPPAGRGLCGMHWQRWKKHGDPNYQRPARDERFWARVDKSAEGGCWLWTGTTFSTGYGALWVDGGQKLAHRLSYEMNVGPIPGGRQLDHLCRVRACVNPEHLEPVTIRENLMRGETNAAANAAKTHCPYGHPYDEVNTYVNPSGHRVCRECSRSKFRDWYRENRSPGTPTNAEKTHCPQGHEYTPENTYIHAEGKRRCRTCVLENNRRSDQRRRAAKKAANP